MSGVTKPWDLPSMADHLDDALHVAGKRVLDIGCGAGWLVRRLASRGADAVGVECGQVMLAQALESDPNHPERYIEAVGQHLPFADEAFDVAVFSFSLHHVPDSEMRNALREAARVVRSGGMVHVVEPVADGVGHHHVDVLVDDETHVRALAQAAIDQVAPQVFDETANDALTMGTPYAGFADYEAQMIGIDPERIATMAANRDAVEAAFNQNAIERNGQWWFEDHLLIRSFRRR